MTTSPLDLEEYRRWMSQAEKTLEAIIPDIEHGFYSWACFKAQQAVEFALKAVLALLGRPRYGHSLVKLLEVLVDICLELNVQEVIECIYYLDKMYIPTRYPDAHSEGAPWEHYSKFEAEKALRCAELVLRQVKNCVERLTSGKSETETDRDRPVEDTCRETSK